MNSFKNIVLLLVVLSIGSCKKNQKLSAEDWVNASIKSHRMDDFNNKKVAFSFREFNYTQNKDAQGIIYTRSKKQLELMIKALANNDPMLGLPHSDPLANKISKVRDKIFSNRLEAEVQAQYFQTLLVHIDIAILVVDIDNNIGIHNVSNNNMNRNGGGERW